MSKILHYFIFIKMQNKYNFILFTLQAITLSCRDTVISSLITEIKFTEIVYNLSAFDFTWIDIGKSTRKGQKCSFLKLDIYI